MKLLDLFDEVVADYLKELIEIGSLRYSKTPSPYKERRSLGVKSPAADFEILLWESGEVEFGFGVEGDSHEQSLRVASESDMRDLLRRFLEVGRTWRPADG